jgi:anti-anti-sigma factor
MEITRHSVGKITVLRLSGDIKARNDEVHFGPALMNATSPVVLNLAGVSSIDSDGIGMIIAGCNAFIRQRDGWIVLAELSKTMGDTARNLFGRMLKTFDTEQEAAQFLRKI